MYIAISSFLIEIHATSPSLSKSTILCSEKWLEATEISYRRFVPFSPALGKHSLLRKNHSLSVEIYAGPRKANLLFAEVFLSREILSNTRPSVLVKGSEPARFIASNFEFAEHNKT